MTAQVRLSQVTPELVAYINAGLRDQGQLDLIPTVDALVIHAIQMSGSHVSLDTVRDLDGRVMMENPSRERIWIGRPRGVRRRSWSITLEVIGGEIWHVGLSRPGILRSAFQKVARDYERPSLAD